ncbi:MAG: hypothetical protein HC844_04030 [Tabrizicola sp.]|nr:hypothetical protein [Tabrizicola sp.]
MTYQRWADLRRMELNDVIARQTVTWIEAQAEARLAFGRNQALAGLVERQGKK